MSQSKNSISTILSYQSYSLISIVNNIVNRRKISSDKQSNKLVIIWSY